MTKTNRIVDLFENEADCLPLNIHMLHNVGIEETIVYSFLLRKKFEEKAEEFFAVSLEEMQKALSLNEYHQRKAVNNLVRQGYIEVTYRGLPAKRYFKVIKEVY